MPKTAHKKFNPPAKKAQIDAQAAQSLGQLLSKCIQRQTPDIEQIKALIDQGASLEEVDSNGSTPLISAVHWGHLEVVKLLIKNRAKLKARHKFSGDTALIKAARENNIEIMAALLDAKADINEQNIHGDTPLIVAAKEGHIAAVEFLVARKADLNLVNNGGATALMWAAVYNKADVVRVLALNKASLDIISNTGNTALLYAVREHNFETVRVLADAGASVLIADSRKRTAISLAREGLHHQIADYLKPIARQQILKKSVALSRPIAASVVMRVQKTPFQRKVF